AVRRAEILDEDLVGAADEAQVPPRDRRIVEAQRALDVAADHGLAGRQLDAVAQVFEEHARHVSPTVSRREIDAEHAAAAFAVFDIDPAVVLFDDARAHGEPEPRAALAFLR